MHFGIVYIYCLSLIISTLGRDTLCLKSEDNKILDKYSLVEAELLALPLAIKEKGWLSNIFFRNAYVG